MADMGIPVMRTGILYCAVLVLASCSTGPKAIVSISSTGPKAIVSINGEAFRGVESFTRPYANPSAAYRVKVTIRNTTNDRLPCDQIQAVFYGEHGGDLKQPAILYDPDGSRSSEIGPGVTKVVNFQTDGYTSDLLRDAGGKPLSFGITVIFNGGIVAGPYVALLPALDTLPYQEDDDARLKPVKLSFSLVPRSP